MQALEIQICSTEIDAGTFDKVRGHLPVIFRAEGRRLKRAAVRSLHRVVHIDMRAFDQTFRNRKAGLSWLLHK